jgi:hypothetical protein
MDTKEYWWGDAAASGELEVLHADNGRELKVVCEGNDETESS